MLVKIIKKVTTPKYTLKSLCHATFIPVYTYLMVHIFNGTDYHTCGFFVFVFVFLQGLPLESTMSHIVTRKSQQNLWILL